MRRGSHPAANSTSRTPGRMPAAYMAHTLAAWEAGEDVLAMVRDALLFAYQKELAVALGVLALWRRQRGGIGRREQHLQW